MKTQDVTLLQKFEAALIKQSVATYLQFALIIHVSNVEIEQ